MYQTRNAVSRIMLYYIPNYIHIHEFGFCAPLWRQKLQLGDGSVCCLVCVCTRITMQCNLSYYNNNIDVIAAGWKVDGHCVKVVVKLSFTLPGCVSSYYKQSDP